MNYSREDWLMTLSKDNGFPVEVIKICPEYHISGSFFINGVTERMYLMWHLEQRQNLQSNSKLLHKRISEW